MGRVLIIGAGGVGTVVAHKVAQNADVFTDIMIASRTKEKCDKIVEAIGNPNIKTAKVDADLKKNCSTKSINNRDFTEKAANTLGIIGYAIAIPAEAA